MYQLFIDMKHTVYVCILDMCKNLPLEHALIILLNVKLHVIYSMLIDGEEKGG